MDVILYPSKQLDKLIYIPISDATGMSVDKVRKIKVSIQVGNASSDSLRLPAVLFHISWICDEICAASIKSKFHYKTLLQLICGAHFWTDVLWTGVRVW